MKAKPYDGIITLVDIKTNSARSVIPKGTRGSIVEYYENPEGYAVDLAITDDIAFLGLMRYTQPPCRDVACNVSTIRLCTSQV